MSRLTQKTCPFDLSRKEEIVRLAADELYRVLADTPARELDEAIDNLDAVEIYNAARKYVRVFEEQFAED